MYMKNRSFLLLEAILLVIVLFASKSSVCAQGESDLKRISCDCSEAVLIVIDQSTSYGKTIAPEGYGKSKEFPTDRKMAVPLFRDEHNSAWYLLQFQKDGEAIMEVIPSRAEDDYDFALFPYTDSSSCRDIALGVLKPLRTNLSRNDSTNRGVTGLSGNVSNEFKSEGPGNQFSKSIQVKSGDRYLLVLDNVYPNGKGHLLRVSMVQSLTVAGTVVDEKGLPKVADLTLFDSRGVAQIKTQTDELGKYSFVAKVQPKLNYNLVFSADQSFFAAEDINTEKLKTADSPLLTLHSVLPKLRKGAKYPVGAIQFMPNEAQFVNGAYASLTALYHLMNRNKNLKIQIEGHVNGGKRDPGDEASYIDLSYRRAVAVLQFLVKKGIDLQRIEPVGRGSKEMLFPNPIYESEHQANRRVEIKVIQF